MSNRPRTRHPGRMPSPMHDQHVRTALAALDDPAPSTPEPVMSEDLTRRVDRLQGLLTALTERVDLLERRGPAPVPNELDDAILEVMAKLPLGVHITPAGIAASISQDVKATGDRMVALAKFGRIVKHQDPGHRPTYSRKD